jgi:hypothetical protein
VKKDINKKNVNNIKKNASLHNNLNSNVSTLNLSEKAKKSIIKNLA